MKEFGLQRYKRAITCLVVVLTLVLLFFRIQPEPQATSSSLPPLPKTSSIGEGKLRQLFADQPLAFELNNGQADPRIRFLARGPRTQLLLSAGEATLLAASAKFRLMFAGANRGAKISGEQQLSERRNYLLGNNCAKWQTDVPTFRRVTYQDIYPGIDLTYYGNHHEIEYDFVIAPGANPNAIRLAFDRDVFRKIAPNGDLVLRKGRHELVEHQPQVYQETGSERRTVKGEYMLLPNNEVGFKVGDYDKSKPLIIDPTLVFSSYLGGSGDDQGSSITLDVNGQVYVTGTTSSTNFPTQGPAFPGNKGLSDMFVTKFDGATGNILYSTYIGGSGVDRADSIATDSSGNAYVVGRVDSASTDFPATPGSFGTAYRGGDFDGVVLKLNPQGNGLVYSGFLGGEENDSVEGVAIDANNVAYVTGGTKSNSFPTSVGTYQGSRAGDTDAFLTKINASGSALLYSTFLGGSGTDRGSGVVLGGNGIAYVAGFGASPDFPTEDPFQAGFGGSFDAFVAKFDTGATGINSLNFCSNLGGAGDDKAFGIAIDSSAANVYIVGQTSSNNFPVLNPAQPASGGSFDAFIAKVTSAGAKVYATYYGGSGDDRGTGIAVNGTGVYVTGFAASTNLPVVAPLQLNNGGGFDAFIAKLNPAGTSFFYSTYLGGVANENFVAAVTATNPITVDAASAYVTGYTASTNFPTAVPVQPAKSGGQDAFVARIADATPAADFSLSLTPVSRTVSPGGATTYTVNVTPEGGFTGNISLSITGVPNGATVDFNPASISITDATSKSSTLTITSAANTTPGTYSLSVTGTSGNLQHSFPASIIVSGPTVANLSITKTASPNPGVTLANLTYRVTVTNNGPSPATNVVVTDELPAGVNFISATPTQGSCTGNFVVTCNLGGLANGAFAIVNILVQPQSSGIFTNNGKVTATESDPDPNDNLISIGTEVQSPSAGPSMTDPNLSVKTVVSGLSQPTSMAFIGNNDFFIFEKNTGKVQRVTNGVVQNPPPLDLAVNSGSERGGLGIALHPNFALNGYVYLYWTESSTGVDTTSLAEVPTLGNRVDRYVWNGSTLSFDRNLIKLRAFQADANQQLRGNHNGGVLRFGPDGKLFILMGDNGRRGFLQNLLCGPTATCPGAPVADDQFGGPEPDNNHLTGFILRLNDDGSTPTDNPFYGLQTVQETETTANIRRLYAYGVRNGFGLGFDPYSGNLWDQENGDDAFDEMNRVTAGSNNGWIQMMGPNSRVAQFKQIESSYGSGDLQQLRWSPTLIASTPAAALASLYMLPGAHYNDPEFSWKYAIPASPLGFVQGRGLGPQFEGNMFVGAARTFLVGGFLFRFKLTPDRQHFLFSDARLADLVADNDDKFDIKESESLLIGRDFGISTDIQSGPNGNLFVVSNSNGAVYEISGKQPALFTANLTGAQETPANNSNGTGSATLLLSPDETTARVSLNFSGLTSVQTEAHIHGPGGAGVVAPILFPLPNGNVSDFQITLTPTDVSDLKSGLLYINVHSVNFPSGEIRGQFGTSSSGASLQFSAASYLVSESAGRATVTVTRLGDTSAAASVNYATSDNSGTNNCNVVNGNASSRCDYTRTIGTLQFAAGETFKTIVVPFTDDAYAEGNETFAINLANAVGAILGSPNIATITIADNETAAGANPIDSVDFFVHQHYIDFLGREPDPSGFQFWKNQILSCGTDTQCIEVRRINVSASFFLSIEFQETGYFAERTYKAAYGGGVSSSTLGGPHLLLVPIIRLNEFLPDSRTIAQGVIVGQGNWQQKLDDNKNAFTAEFVQRAQFLSFFPLSLTAAQFVDNLNSKAGNPLSQSERNQLVNDLSTGAKTRAQVLRAVVEDADFISAEFNRAFVLMQYFGYLRRNPNDPQDIDYTGYDFWLTKLNQFNGNYIDAEMVKAFLSSIEYRQRFGP